MVVHDSTAEDGLAGRVLRNTAKGNCPITPSGTATTAREFGWHVSYLDHAIRPWVVWTMMGNATSPECFNAETCYSAPLAWNHTGGNWYPYQPQIVMTRVDSYVTKDSPAIAPTLI